MRVGGCDGAVHVPVATERTAGHLAVRAAGHLGELHRERVHLHRKQAARRRRAQADNRRASGLAAGGEVN